MHSLCYVITVFAASELVAELKPVYNMIWELDPEAFPFRQPVDPKVLGIPVSSSASFSSPSD